jgi:hypothetical protein
MSRYLEIARSVIAAREGYEKNEISSFAPPPEPCDISPAAAADPATEALELLARLRCYCLPSGRMPVVRGLAERLKAVQGADAETILHALQGFERKLIALGGRPDPALAQTVELVQRVFPGARVVGIKNPQ